MSQSPRYRCRLAFAKTDAMRFTGHLDLHRTLERTVRRAGLPLCYTQGFSPHPRLQVAAALPLGCISEGDLADLWLEESLSPAHILAALQSAAPPGIRFEAAWAVEDREPALQQQVRSAEYVVELQPEAGEAGELAAAVESLLAKEHLPRQRRDRTYDLRPLVEHAQVAAQQGGGTLLTLRLSAREGATGRPEEVLAELGQPLEFATIRRTRLLFDPAPSPALP